MSPLTTFDPDKGVLFQGQFEEFKVIDPSEPGHQPNLVIDGTEEFKFDVKWKLIGTEVSAALNDTQGDWSVEVYAESMGPGPDLQIASTTVSKGAKASWTSPKEYAVTLTVPANTLPEGDPNDPTGPSGIYKLVCSCFINGDPALPGKHDIAGFVEGTMIRIENRD